MRLLAQTEDQVDVRLGIDELLLLSTTLHEMCNSMEFTDADFDAILGTSRLEAETLLRRMEAILDRLRILSDPD